MQEATIKAWRGLGTLRSADAVRPWFLTIVANQCRSLLRGRWWSVVKLSDPRVASPSPEAEAVTRSDLGRALDRLDRDSRVALFLRYYLDLPLAEVGQVLGISETAAKSRIQRAAARLRPGLEVVG